jgi:ABC-type multidrug transport system fused ATPase/permease subunit
MERWFEGGENPSMGERQKIAIARALYRCPQLLILDEPTSSIDARSEVEIFEHLLTAPHRHSTILISHRYHTLMAADQIAVVHNGRIAEMGDHATLMQHGGLYAAEFERQAQPYLRGLEAISSLGDAAVQQHLTPKFL